jgi:hypothetical protein
VSFMVLLPSTQHAFNSEKDDEYTVKVSEKDQISMSSATSRLGAEWVIQPEEA